jgi:hypothetical protein
LISLLAGAGKYDPDFFTTGGCYIGVSPQGNGTWEPFSAYFSATSSGATVYLPQQSAADSSWVADLRVAETSEYSLSCSSQWQAKNGLARCGAIGGVSNALEVADAGGWTHAYQEIGLVAGSVYAVTGRFYALHAGVCDDSAKVRWCSPSVVVCPGTTDPSARLSVRRAVPIRSHRAAPAIANAAAPHCSSVSSAAPDCSRARFGV